MRTRRVVMACALVLLLLLVLTSATQAEAPVYVLRSVAAAGGTVSPSGVPLAADEDVAASAPLTYYLSGTVGQTAAGYGANAGGHLVSGFWFWYWRTANIPRQFAPIVFDRYAP
jgi:hypothetical protein